MAKKPKSKLKPPEQAPATPTLTSLAAKSTGELSPGDTVQTAGDKMRELDTEVWPVAEGRKLVGMIEEKHPDRKIAAHGHDPKVWRVSEVMNRNAIFCYEDQNCTEARRIMQENNLNFLPVVDREMRIVGIFSREEIEKGEAQSHPSAA